jgi:hypothetical protein
LRSPPGLASHARVCGRRRGYAVRRK